MGSLGTAYVAYYPAGVTDQINVISDGGEVEGEIPDLPEEVQNMMPGAEEANKLKKIAVITYEIQDDTTVTVNFKDQEHRAKDHTYYFIIPDENLAGIVTAEQE